MSKTAHAAVLGALLVGACAAALAGAFMISPLGLVLSKRAPIGAFVFGNDADGPSVVQARALEWSQVGGQDRLQVTREILVTPPVFTVAAGGRQIVRVALWGAPDARREQAFRLILSGVPRAARSHQVRIALGSSPPVFVQGLRPSAAVIAWRASPGEGGALGSRSPVRRGGWAAAAVCPRRAATHPPSTSGR